MFQMPENVSTDTFKTKVQRLVKQFRLELEKTKEVYNTRKFAAPKIDLYEVMCSSQSELARQVLALGGKAMRFAETDGDLSKLEGRQKLFQMLVIHRPKHVWYSPVCKPWCMWSQFKCHEIHRTE